MTPSLRKILCIMLLVSKLIIFSFFFYCIEFFSIKQSFLAAHHFGWKEMNKITAIYGMTHQKTIDLAFCLHIVRSNLPIIVVKIMSRMTQYFIDKSNIDK